MQARGTLLPAAQVWKYSQQLSDALMHMHDRKMMHRDIKPANVFLSGSKLGTKLLVSPPPCPPLFSPHFSRDIKPADVFLSGTKISNFRY